MNDSEMMAVLANFQLESAELLAEMDECLLRLEDAPDDVEKLNALFRTVHTIKGTAGLFGMNEVVGFTHDVETVLDLMRGRTVPHGSPLSTLLFACKDHIHSLLDLAVADAPLPQPLRQAGVALSAQLQVYSGGTSVAAAAHEAGPAAAAQSVWRISAAFGPGTFEDGFDPLATLGYLAALGTVRRLATRVRVPDDFAAFDAEKCFIEFDIELQTAARRSEIDSAFKFVLDSCRLEIDELTADPGPAIVAEEAVAATAAASAPRNEEQRMVRVPAEKLDQLINLVGELVIAGSGGNALARKHRIKELVASASHLNALIEEVRDRALSLRMVAIGETFTRFKRIVRDLSAKMGKSVELELRGTEAELDKSMVERLNEPLVHIVRNSLDHGIERPEQRQAAGKPATAKLVLSARHEGGGVVISVSDDGAGLNRERILAKARERGLVADGAELSDEQVHELIFAPGFSTAEAVTDMSGRGVGMDVVRRTIEDLRGNVMLRSRPGEGTTIELRLPLTLAIIDGFHVRVGDHQFVLPMTEVVECINTRHMNPPADGAVTGHMSLRGAVLPVVHLRQLFELEGPPGERQSIVVVRSAGQQVGLVMDALLGEGQTVIKPMGELFQQLEGIAGSTVLGTGEVALILDVPALVALAVRGEAPSARAATFPQAA